MRLWLLILVFFSALQALEARAQSTAPQPTLEAASRRLQALLTDSSGAAALSRDEREIRLERLLDELFDIERMARDAVGAHWNTLSEDQRLEYMRLLRRLVYQAAVQQVRSGLVYSVQIGASVTNVRRARIETIVALEGPTRQRNQRQTLFLVFFMERNERGWQVIEVEVDGVRLVRGYRLQFHRVIVGSGFDELLRRMRSRLDLQSP